MASHIYKVTLNRNLKKSVPAINFSENLTQRVGEYFLKENEQNTDSVL